MNVSYDKTMMGNLKEPPPAKEPRGQWKWLLALGAVLLVLGIAGISVATLLQIGSALIFGPMLLVSGIMQLFTAFLTEKRAERLLHYLAAGLEMVLGFFIITNPIQNVRTLLAIAAAFFIGIGMLRLARALVARSHGRGWIIVTGLAALLVGAALWLGASGAKLALLWLWIAVDFLCGGASWSALSLFERQDESSVSGVPAAARESNAGGIPSAS